MAKKKSSHSGHYCKICGEYKANEKFSGRGHATHICKACSRLSAAEKAEAMTINRLYNLPMRRLTDSEKKWLENRVHDQRPEVASLAKEIYNMRFPHAARNAMKKQLTIDTLIFEVHAEVYDEYGDFEIVNRRFTADRHSRILAMKDFDCPNMDCTLTLDAKQISNLLLWTVNALEVFMWAEDYGLSDDDIDGEPDFDPLLDNDFDFDFEDEDGNDLDDTDSESEPEQDGNKDVPYWRVQIKYSNGTEQDTANYSFDYLTDKPEDLYDALWEYFALDEPDDWDAEEDF